MRGFCLPYPLSKSPDAKHARRGEGQKTLPLEGFVHGIVRERKLGVGPSIKVNVCFGLYSRYGRGREDGREREVNSVNI